MKDLCGQQIDGYHAMRLLGRGGMAEVYEVRHDQLGVRRAMKVFTADGKRAELLKSRFLAEDDSPHRGGAIKGRRRRRAPSPPTCRFRSRTAPGRTAIR